MHLSATMAIVAAARLIPTSPIGIVPRESNGNAIMDLSTKTGEEKLLGSDFIYGFPDNGEEAQTVIPGHFLTHIKFDAWLMLGWLGVYYSTVGPICYAVITEVSSTRLRNKSVCISRIAYYVAQIVCNSINPETLNPTAGNWCGKTGFF